MDPDLVRQQEEAERESLAPPPKKPIPLANLYVVRASEEAIEAIEAKPEPTISSEPPLTQDPTPSTWTSAAALGVTAIMRFVQFSLAGGILGGVLGAAVANYFELAAQAAQIAIFAPAGFMALLCGWTSFRTQK
jgi:hypothetical protein